MSQGKHNHSPLTPFLVWTERHLTQRQFILLLSFFVGIGAALAAQILKWLIANIEHLLIGRFDITSANQLLLVYPVVGIFLTALFIKYVVRDDISHGVTKILYAISRGQGKIKRHNCWSSVVASALTIGFGGSVGAESPIVLTGSAIGSRIGKAFHLDHKSLMLLIGCGASGAVAGIFKAPIAGLVFTLEVLMLDLTMASLLPLLVSCLTATCVTYALTGTEAMFAFRMDEAFRVERIPSSILLGVFCGLISLYFTRTMNAFEQVFGRIGGLWPRLALGGGTLALLIFLFPPLYGEGYGSLTNLLNGDVKGAIGTTFLSDVLTRSNPWLMPLFFLMVFLFKVFSMSLTNAGGGVGGTFGPTLFMGGVLGFVVARLFNLCGFSLPETNFALVAMAGLMSGVMQAPLTAIFLIAEITGGYDLLMPLIITSAVSFATIRLFESYSIYTKRIANQGDLLTHDSDKAVLTLLNTANLVERDFKKVKVGDNLGTLVKAISNSRRNLFPVVNDLGELQGVVYLDDLRQIMFNRDMYSTSYVYNFMKPFPETVQVDEKMESVMKKFEVTDAWNLPVLDSNGCYIGFVSKSKIFSAYRERLQQVSQE